MPKTVGFANKIYAALLHVLVGLTLLGYAQNYYFHLRTFTNIHKIENLDNKLTKG
jgi:hypothetical protein